MGLPRHLQIAVYAGLGVVLVLLGLKALSGPAAGASAGPAGGVSVASAPVGGGTGAGGKLVVDVAGAVRRPGVYELEVGSRVTDAVERAGGARPSANPDAINLAARLDDGQQVVVPAAPKPGAGPGTSSTDSGGATASAGGDAGPISLGSATEADLESIDGIGPVTAADIIEYRDSHGGIASLDQLDEIPGIGPATIASLGQSLQP